MKERQLSVRIDGHDDETEKIIRTVENEGIHIKRFDITVDRKCTTLHLTVSDAERAEHILRSEGYDVNVNQVVCIQCAGTPGAVSAVLARLSRENVAVESVHAFSQGYTAEIVIRPNDTDACERLFSYEKGVRPNDEPAAIFKY